MNEQQKYIEQLCLKCFPECDVANDYLNNETQKYQPGKRVDRKKYEIHDERTIFLNEIVFDLDYTSYIKNYQTSKMLLEVFESRNIKPIICHTGGKGIHIHIFFNKLNFQTKEGKELMKTAFAYGLTWRQLRLWFYDLIINESGINKLEVGNGKKIDSFPLAFDHFEGTTRLIRDIGGRKYIKTADGTFKKHYKTYIPIDEFTDQKPNVVNFENVKYPQNIELFEINENELMGFLENYIKQSKDKKIDKLNNEKLDIKYLQIDGVQKVMNGLATGQRNNGALIISIACKIDEMDYSDALQVLNEYVKNCSQAEHSFNINEAKQWLDWVWGQDKVFWNCAMLENIGLHTAYDCEFCKKKNKEAVELLTKTTLLNQIKEVLDNEIVGEDHNKVLIFLLLLSKDFPSETGLPGWNIPGDPSAQNVILASDSASGKSYILKHILKLFGEEEVDYFTISRMTKNAINYYTEQNMDGKIIFIEEMQGLDENTSQLRVWMSEGKLTLKTVEKVKNEDGIEVNKLVKQTTIGQPCFVTCQAEGKIEEQLNNRSWIISLDVSDTQTSEIIKYQVKQNKRRQQTNDTKLRIIKDALKQLKPYHYQIPFVEHIAKYIPTKDVRVRRDFQKFLTLIKCSAYLHQNQRHIISEDGFEYLLCDVKDYEIARQYSENILGATFTGLTNIQIDLINFIKRSSWSNEFQIMDIMRNLGKSQSYWYNQLKQLEDLGFITCEHTAGKTGIYSLVMDKAINVIKLPSCDEISKMIDNDK